MVVVGGGEAVSGEAWGRSRDGLGGDELLSEDDNGENEEVVPR